MIKLHAHACEERQSIVLKGMSPCRIRHYYWLLVYRKDTEHLYHAFVYFFPVSIHSSNVFHCLFQLYALHPILKNLQTNAKYLALILILSYILIPWKENDQLQPISPKSGWKINDQLQPISPESGTIAERVRASALSH